MTKTTQWYFPVSLILNSLALIAAGLVTIAANAEFQSTTRTGLAVGTFIFAAVALISGIWLTRNPQKNKQFISAVTRINQRTRALNLATGILFALFWGLSWLPAEKTGSYFYYFVGLQPLIVWAAFASGFALVLGLTLSPGFSLENGRAYWREQKITLGVTLATVILFGLLAALTTWLKPWHANEPYWYGAGVPLLIWQVYVVILVVILVKQLRAAWPHHLDVLLFFAIWGVAAFFWVNQPLQESFFFTPRLFPNHEYYPFADLETFDRASQYALIGQGINNGDFFDRTLYIAFLIYLHTFAGQNYELLMNIQAGIFAIFPAIVYLIGKNLHSRTAGLIAAALAVWRGINALAAMSIIDTATAKHMLTDFPTAIGLAVFCLLLILWLKNPQENWAMAAWAAGTLSLTSLLRPHVMAVLIVFLLVVLLRSLPRLRTGLALTSLAFVAAFASIAPWTFFSGNNISIIDLYATRIRNVINERYRTPEQMPAVPGTSGLLSVVLPQSENKIETPFAVAHFLNNMQTSAFSLPIQPQMISLKETVKKGEAVWQIGWQGDLSSQAAIMISLGLALTALGMGAAAQKSLTVGLAPVGVFVIYTAANSLARTSGGRYIVPADWIVILFFGLGLAVFLEAVEAFFKRQASPAESAPPTAEKRRSVHWAVKAAGIISFFGLAGGLIPLSQHIHPVRYEPGDRQKLLAALEPVLPGLGLEQRFIEAFLQNNGDGVLIEGTALYPRFWGQGEGFPSWEPYNAVEYPRTIFVLIGPQPGYPPIMLAGPAPKFFPHNSHVIVVGCGQQTSGVYVINAHIVVLDNDVVYRTSPERPLECPIQPPLCNNNKSCR